MNDKPVILQTYKKDGVYSYTSGAYATIEMLKARPQIARVVYIHSKYTDKDGLHELCAAHGVPIRYGDKNFAKVNQKENAYVMGIFEKYTQHLSPDRPHIVLVNPGDMGNIGTIIRTAAGLGFCDMGIILPAGDIFHPKTIRASMGALFHIHVQCFPSFGAYQAEYSKHHCYPFMLDGAAELHTIKKSIERPFTLIFGNEAAGLDPAFSQIGVSVRIPQTACVDSLNIAIAVGIGAFTFMNDE